jgi:hypothetical protein
VFAVDALRTINGSYNFDQPFANRRVNDGLRYNGYHTGNSKMWDYGAKASGEVWSLPAGPVLAAIGAQYIKQEAEDIPDPQIAAGNALGISASAAYGEQKVTAIYGEIIVPIVKGVEVTGALRYDSYSGTGDFSNTSPKIGVRWQPTKNLLLRAALRGVPGSVDLRDVACDADVVHVRHQGPGQVRQRRRAGLPDRRQALPARQSGPEAREVGRLEPGRRVRADRQLVDLGRRLPDQAGGRNRLVRRPAPRRPVPERPEHRRPRSGHRLDPVDQPGAGPAQQDDDVGPRHRGARAHPDGTAGRLELRGNLSTSTEYEFTTLGDDATQTTSSLNGISTARAAAGHHSVVQARDDAERVLHHSYDQLSSSPSPTKVGAVGIWNLLWKWNVSKNFTVNAAVLNLFDTDPPFADTTAGSNAGYDFSIHDPRGRFFQLGVNYRFK